MVWNRWMIERIGIKKGYIKTQLENNKSKDNDYPRWKTIVSSNGTTNCYNTQYWEVK